MMENLKLQHCFCNYISSTNCKRQQENFDKVWASCVRLSIVKYPIYILSKLFNSIFDCQVFSSPFHVFDCA